MRVLVLPGLRPKGDIVDWIGTGGTREQLDALVAEAPLWLPPIQTDKPSAEDKAKAQAEEQRILDESSRLQQGVDYDRRRREAASQLGVSRGSIDREVQARRRQRVTRSGHCIS